MMLFASGILTETISSTSNISGIPASLNERKKMREKKNQSINFTQGRIQSPKQQLVTGHFLCISPKMATKTIKQDIHMYKWPTIKHDKMADQLILDTYSTLDYYQPVCTIGMNLLCNIEGNLEVLSWVTG